MENQISNAIFREVYVADMPTIVHIYRAQKATCTIPRDDVKKADIDQSSTLVDMDFGIPLAILAIQHRVIGFASVTNGSNDNDSAIKVFISDVHVETHRIMRLRHFAEQVYLRIYGNQDASLQVNRGITQLISWIKIWR